MGVAWDKKTMLDSSGLPSQANAGVLFQEKKKARKAFFSSVYPKSKVKNRY